MATMKITVIDGVVINGKDYFDGDVEVDVATAIRLINSGKAKVSSTSMEEPAKQDQKKIRQSSKQ